MNGGTIVEKEKESFNTDNGIRRATMSAEEILDVLYTSFNTDNGIRRATIRIMRRKSMAELEFQYRQRYQEGYNTVPLSPWGYWPQMSKMENLIDFPTFSSLRQQALFAFCVATTSETLVLQGLAVFGKKSENLRPFGRSKRFSIFR